jgi:SWI/SNF-related matrix-associated actin-dependent regulator of chromatin subfamily A3
MTIAYVDSVGRHTVPWTLTWYKYHRQMKDIQLLDLLQYDVVLTTYGTLATGSSRSKSVLQQVDWYRIILDEGKMESRR